MSEKDILKELIGIHSSFPHEKDIAIFIESFLKKHGFTTNRDYVERDRFNILAEKGTGQNALLFYGHIDTVPIYGDWKTKPLLLTKNGDKLYGVGTHDMKGGVAAVLESTKDAKNRHIKLLFCVDEENISKGAWTTVKRHKSWFDDVGVIITGEAGVTDQNEGGIDIVTLGRRGRCVITVYIEGISSHGAEPDIGLSALEQAAKIALNINKIRLKDHKQLGKESIFVSEIKSSSTSLSVPDRAYLDFDIHLVPPSTSEEAKTRISNYIKKLTKQKILDNRAKFKVQIKKRETPYLDPYVTSPNNKYVAKIISLAKKHARRKITLSYGLSVADENVFANALKIPNVTIGPQGGNEHSANEWVSERSLKDITDLFKDIISSV